MGSAQDSGYGAIGRVIVVMSKVAFLEDERCLVNGDAGLDLGIHYQPCNSWRIYDHLAKHAACHRAAAKNAAARFACLVLRSVSAAELL